MRIVRLANFVTVHTGGLRTALRQLGRGYQRAGHEAVLVVPGRRHSDRMTKQGRVITLPSAPLPRGSAASSSMPCTIRPTRVTLRSRWRGEWPSTT